MMGRLTYHIFDVDDVLTDEDVLTANVDVFLKFFVLDHFHVFTGVGGGCDFCVRLNKKHGFQFSTNFGKIQLTTPLMFTKSLLVLVSSMISLEVKIFVSDCKEKVLISQKSIFVLPCFQHKTKTQSLMEILVKIDLFYFFQAEVIFFKLLTIFVIFVFNPFN